MSNFRHPFLPIIFIVFSILLVGCSRLPVSETQTAPASSTTINADTVLYVSLGDSIAHGYGLISPSAERYSAITAELIERSGIPVTLCSYGVNGQTSTGLLTTLTDGTVPLDVLSDMKLCSINIGANNVLGPGMRFLYDYYQYLYSEPASYDDVEIAEKYRVFTEECNAGIEQLQLDIPKIVQTLKDAAPDVEILFLTLYNPYAHSPIVLNINGMPIQLAALADTYCTLVNRCILDGSDNGTNYRVVDVYTAFFGTDGAYVNVTNPEGLSETDIDMSAMDPHPNKAGHARIAKCIVDTLQNVP